MRYIVLILLALTLAAATPAQAATRQPSGPCDGAASIVKPAMGYAKVAKRVRQLVRCAAHHYRISASKMTCVAYRESRWWPWSSSGSSSGVMQQNVTYWPGRVRTFWHREWMPRHPMPSVFNARANVLVSAAMIRAGGWSPWASTAGGC